MWDWLVVAAVIAGALATLAALVFLAVRVLQAWRDLKRLRRHVAKEVDRLADAVERLAGSAEQAGDTTRLQAHADRLRTTLAQFAVLRDALDEVSDTVGRVTAFVPGK